MNRTSILMTTGWFILISLTVQSEMVIFAFGFVGLLWVARLWFTGAAPRPKNSFSKLAYALQPEAGSDGSQNSPTQPVRTIFF